MRLHVISSEVLVLICLWYCTIPLTTAIDTKNGKKIQKRAAPDANVGLQATHLSKNTVAVGFLPGWGEVMQPNNCSSINERLPEPMSVVGVYVQIRQDDPTFTQLDWFLQDILNQPGPLPVLNLALMPIEGFDTVTQQVANNIAAKMHEVNEKGLSIWLRYAHEMNGNWYPYGVQPEAFIASWEMVSNAVHNATNSTWMLFAPNSMFANDYNVSNPLGGYTAYWPNDPDTVELAFLLCVRRLLGPGLLLISIVGLSFYTYGTQERLNIMPPQNMAINTLKTFDSLYGSALGKPLVLAETGASFTYSMDWETAPGNASESAIKFDWLWQLLGPDTIQQIPSLKAITWFEVLKSENAGYNTDTKIEDFRLVLGKDYIEESVIHFFDQSDTVNTSSTSQAQASQPASSGAAGTKLGRQSILLMTCLFTYFAL